MKPRLDLDEVKDGVSMLLYRGDIVNSEEFTPEACCNCHTNMAEVYYQYAHMLSIIQAFSTGRYANISWLRSWNLEFIEKTENDPDTENSLARLMNLSVS